MLKWLAKTSVCMSLRMKAIDTPMLHVRCALIAPTLLLTTACTIVDHTIHLGRTADDLMKNIESDLIILDLLKLLHSNDESGGWMDSHEPTVIAQLLLASLTLVAGK